MTWKASAWKRSARSVAIAIAIAAPAGLTSAQPRDPAGADKLYDEASALLAKGDWTNGCPKFEQSNRLDPSTGAVLKLAECAEHDGRLARAWSYLKDARSLNADTQSAKLKKEIEDFCTAGLARLEPRIPQLTVSIKDRPEGLRVLRDGQDITSTLDTALPVDPGKHVIEVSAKGYKSQKAEIDVAEGSRPTWEGTLEKDPTAVEPDPKPDPIDPDPKPDPKPDPNPKPGPGSGLNGVQLAGFVVGALGLGLVGVSIGTGVAAMGQKSDLDALGCTSKAGADGDTILCPSGSFDTAKELSETGSTLALTSTVTTFVGGAVALSGVVLVVVGSLSKSAPRSDDAASSAWRITPVVGPSVFAASLTGEF